MSISTSKIKKHIVTFIAIFFMLSLTAHADVVEDLDKMIKEQQQQLEELAQQKDAYLTAIKTVQESVNTLANEITLLDNQILELETEIKAYQLEIKTTKLEIQRFGIEIDQKQEAILRQRMALKDIIRVIDGNDKKSTLEIMLGNDNFSEFLDEVSYTETVQSKIQELVNSIRADKEKLEKAKLDEIAKKNKLESLEAGLRAQKIALAAEEDNKKQLMEKTKGEEVRYQKLLSDIIVQREQILGDIEDLREQKKAELDKIKARLSKPKANLTALDWYWSQTDARWGDSYIGLSNTKMKNYGCAVAALAMLFKYHNIDVNPGILARQPIFYYDLIVWPKVWRYLDLVLNTYHKGVDWKRVDKELADGHPVIVFINATRKNAGHYVVIFDKDAKDYIVNDPMPWDGISGANMYLGSTREYLGKLYDSPTVVDQMIVYH